MKKYLIIFISLVFMVSCKESYEMPNYFKHHENGAVKQISMQTFETVNGMRTLCPDNYIILWGESGDGTSTYDENGNILSDKYYNYNYTDNGQLESTINKNVGTYGQHSLQNFMYNERNEIQTWGDYTFTYNDNNQISKIVEDVKSQNYYPASYREYMYNDDGKMISCNINRGSTIYENEYNEDGELQRQTIRLGALNTREYQITITERDEKGNWTERHITTPTNEYIQTREILYY